jgi:glucose/mannose-6-phosphate isomerase
MGATQPDPLASILNDPGTWVRNDPAGLLGRIESLPDQCEEGWRNAAALLAPDSYASARELVITGMGGSAIAGDMLRSIAMRSARKPVYVVRGYDMPAFVGPETLVVACSHSGNTEETLSSFQQALGAGAMGFVIATGGELAELAQRSNVPLFGYTYDGEPRSALGHQLMALLALSVRIGLLEGQEAAVREATSLMREQQQHIGSAVAVAENPAKQLALRLRGRIAAVVGAGILTEAAHRWKTQLNENAKCWAMWEELPELDHNSIEGFGLAAEAVPLVHVVFLYHEALGARMRRRYDATAEEYEAAGVTHERVETPGTTPLAQLLTSVYFGDLTSYYLGMLNGVNPSPVPAIMRLKARLAEP